MKAHDRHARPFQPRIEDDRLVRGLGCFSDDLRSSDDVAAFFVRSPYAFAEIVSIDIAAAANYPGVLLVLTSADMKAGGIGNVSRPMPMVGRNGSSLRVPFRPALADERAMHIGQPVALVVATSPRIAQEAAELVDVDYVELKPIVGARAAIAVEAPRLWDEAPSNIAIDWPGPVPDDGANEHEVSKIFAAAPYVASVALVNQRLVVASMEPRGATAMFDHSTGTYTLRCGSQGVYALRKEIAAIMGIPTDLVRVMTDDVGGAFGMKTPVYPEYVALLVAARQLGRPVHWMSSRSEAFVSDNQARDTVTEGLLALDGEGRFLALRMQVLADMGAFLSTASAFIATSNFARCLPGVYSIPRVAVSVRCVFTNSLPTAPYRGAGRPEANYAMERLVEQAATITRIDSVELRRRNMIAPHMLPHATPAGTTIDSGDFEAILDRALLLSGHAGFAMRRSEAAARGRMRGIGISCFLEHSGGTPTETAVIAFPGNGTIELSLGVQGTGQGQGTVFGRMAAERLGVARERIVVRQGDTSFGLPSRGGSSTASRSTMTAGTAVLHAIDTLIGKGRRIAAEMLEAGESDVEYGDGAFVVRGTDRRLSLFSIAEGAPGSAVGTLDTGVTTDVPQTFPNGCHIAEVEIDPYTGTVEIVAYTAVDDSGRVLDPVLVEGQIQGGIAQGIGQALFEEAIYDAESGQLITGSFTDYALPRADGLPHIVSELYSVPATTNPLGVKGAGESGTTGSLAAVMNAIADAIPGAAIEMPATPARVWQACRGRERTKGNVQRRSHS